MTCRFSREALALYVEGDLSGTRERLTSSHVATCDECQQFLEQLRASQSQLKSLRREAVRPSDCTGMRRDVMAIINQRTDQPGWMVRLERALWLGRRPSYALVAVGLLAVVSVSVLAQRRQVAPGMTSAVAVFEGRDTLLRPEGYREWIRVDGLSMKPQQADIHRGARAQRRTVYINPSGYGAYARTGQFPEGTLMIWESSDPGPHALDRSRTDSPVLLASVKDSTRFDGGWGFFDFKSLDGALTTKAQAQPESSGCRTCHQRDAETDHVFTQFYPALQTARRAAPRAQPEARAHV